MFDALLADGLASGLGERLAMLAVKCLAVAGGFLVGYFLGGMIAWALDRWVFAQRAPDPLKKTVAVVAGIALAILVALIVFGEGGSGLFGGGGGDGKGTPSADDNKGKAAPAPPEPKKEEVPPKKEEQPKAPPKPMPGDVRVTILAGDEVKEGRFYVFDDDPAPKNFEEFKQEIVTRRKEAKPELKQVIFRFKKEKLSQNHPAVRNVVAWLSASGIGAPFE